MLPTDSLEREHDGILGVLDGMRRTARDIQSEGDADREEVEEFLDFARNFADDYHHKKEEDILFEKMAERGMPKQGSPVGMMLHEHDLMRGLLDSAESALENGDDEAVAKTLSKYASTLEEHIGKENNILYPMANKILPEADQEEMRTAFDEADSSFDDGYEERYREFAERFEGLKARQ